MNNNPNVLVKISNAGIHKNGKWLVKDVNLEIHRGKIVTIIGPNGSGNLQLQKLPLVFSKELREVLRDLQKKSRTFPRKY